MQRSTASALLFGTALATTASWALNASAQTPSKPANNQLEVVVVTAQKRSENVQKVATAVTVIGGRDLERKAIVRMEDLQTAAPSLTITNTGPIQFVNIRGIGIASTSPSVSNGVATYLDGIFVPPGNTNNSYYDLASVEVLRGPQGTFVGNNSTGGAIFVNSASPQLGGYHGSLEASVSNYGGRATQAMINVPVTDYLAIRGAINYRYHDSFYDDLGPYHNKAGSLNELAERLGVIFRPNDAFQAIAKIETVRHDTDGVPQQPIPGTADAPAISPSSVYDLDYAEPTKDTERSYQASLEMRYTFPDQIVVRSVSGLRDNDNHGISDNCGCDITAPSFPGIDGSTKLNARERDWTQEINIISPTDGRFSWIGGAYYLRDRIDLNLYNTIGDYEFGPPDGPPAGTLVPYLNIYNPVEKEIYGIFAQGTYKILPNLKLDIGARYSGARTSQTGAVSVFTPFGKVPVATLDGAEHDAKPTGKVSLNWQVTPDNLVYAFVARGYKQGGINSGGPELKPETIIDYETGWKANFFDNHIHTSVGGFYYDYNNFQFSSFNLATGTSGTINLTNATIKGLEGQVASRWNNFDIDGGFAYVDSNLAKFAFVDTIAWSNAHGGATADLPQCGGTNTQVGVTCYDYNGFTEDASGPNLYSPKWTINGSVDYNFYFSDYQIVPQIKYSYIGSQFTYPGYRTTEFLKAQNLIDASIAGIYRNYTATIFATNLADAKFVTGQNGNLQFYNEPRQFGLRVHMAF